GRGGRLRSDRPALADGARRRRADRRAGGGRSVIALVTGASSGIGEATARLLARGANGQSPAHVVLVARREDRLRELAAQLGEATVIAADLVDDGAPQRIAETVEREHGRLDLLVNNAGAAWRESFADGGYENVRRTMEL